MTENEVKNLGFWITLHRQAYKDGIQYADLLRDMIHKQKQIDSEVDNVDDSIQSHLLKLEENGISDDGLLVLFNRTPEYYQKKLDDENKEHELPEAESY